MGKLVLYRRTNESIVVGDDVVITVIKVRGDKVRLSIDAPTDVKVHRQEVYDAIQFEVNKSLQEAAEESSEEHFPGDRSNEIGSAGRVDSDRNGQLSSDSRKTRDRGED